MVERFVAFPIKLYNFIKGFVTSKKSQPIFENKIEPTDYETDFNFEDIATRVELVKKAIDKGNLVRIEEHTGNGKQNITMLKV
ncbi:MAG TPA: hypothetical protein LFW21_04510 [Rickettsia endosymbiont of Pyrocoelia pectoralis]|nr:hypothetical protein [Rickettsia endosymbiont of Pyrocoelia pectoralis]